MLGQFQPAPFASPYLIFKGANTKKTSPTYLSSRLISPRQTLSCRRPSSAPASGDDANDRPPAPGRRSPSRRYVDSSSPVTSRGCSCRSGLGREIVPEPVDPAPTYCLVAATAMGAGAHARGIPSGGGRPTPALLCLFCLMTHTQMRGHHACRGFDPWWPPAPLVVGLTRGGYPPRPWWPPCPCSALLVLPDRRKGVHTFPILPMICTAFVLLFMLNYRR
jgi:hypothetical protein